MGQSKINISLYVVTVCCSMHTVFGRVVDGQKYVTEIENQRVDTNHRPYADIRIVRCGELVLIKPSKGEEISIHGRGVQMD